MGSYVIPHNINGQNFPNWEVLLESYIQKVTFRVRKYKILRLKILFKILSTFYEKFLTEPIGPLIYKQQVETTVYVKITLHCINLIGLFFT